MDDFQIQRLLAEISTLKSELRLANALKYLELQDFPPPTPKEIDLSIDRALRNIKENYGP